MSTEFEYYDNPDEWGKYQYVTLDDVITNTLMSRDEDSYISHVPRYKLLYQAKRGLRELYYDVLKEIRAFEMELSPQLTITLPPDYVNYVRISWVDEHGNLHPMAMNTNRGYADRYLQDNAFNLMFDDAGNVLIDSGNAPNMSDNESDSTSVCAYSVDGFVPNKNASGIYPNGSFIINNRAGILQFSSDVKSKNVVVEYISDGLYDNSNGTKEPELSIHKFAEKAIMDFIYYELIAQRATVPANEKARARKEYYNSRRVAKRRINTLRRQDIIQAFKGSSRWVKN